MVEHPTLPLCGSVSGEGSERGLCHCLASEGLPGTCPISSHFTHSLYMTGALPAVVLVLNPRVGVFAYVLRAAVPLSGVFLKYGSLFCYPNPHWFLQPECMEIYFPGVGTMAWVIWSVAGVTRSQGIPPHF